MTFLVAMNPSRPGAGGSGTGKNRGRGRLMWAGALSSALVAFALVAPAGPARTDVAPQGPAGPVLPAASTTDPTGTSPEPAVVAQLLDAMFADGSVSNSLGASVFDPATGNVLYERDSLTPRTPASVVKILTAVSVLDALGPLARITTNVHYDPASMTLTLVGAGDPTLATTQGEGSSLAALADGVLAASNGPGANAAVQLRYDASLFGGPVIAEGWSPVYPATGVVAPPSALSVDGSRAPDGVTFVADPALTAAAAFAEQLQQRGLQVDAPQQGVAAGAAVVASTSSVPLATMTQRMLTDSDNTMAEVLGHLAGATRSGVGSFATSAQAVDAALSDLDISASDVTLYDASGLSTANSVPARTFTQVLSSMVRNPAMWWAWPIPSGLPVAGVTGTLANRFFTADTFAGAGVVRAKTGTLTGVSSLVGTVVDRDGRLLVFAFIADGAGDIDQSRSVLDQAATVLAQCGCRVSS